MILVTHVQKNRPHFRTLLLVLLTFSLPTFGQGKELVDTLETAPALGDSMSHKPVFALRTNLLVPLLNVGVEVPLGNRWSVAADYYYPWLFRKGNHKNCFQLLFWSAEGRYWFGKRHKRGAENFANRLKGHSVGVYAGGGYYDVERNYSGHQGTVYSAGADYLYAMPVFKGKLNLTFSFAVGYIYSDAQGYRVREEGGRLLRKPYVKNRLHYFGPTKAGVSFVLPIGKNPKRKTQ